MLFPNHYEFWKSDISDNSNKLQYCKDSDIASFLRLHKWLKRKVILNTSGIISILHLRKAKTNHEAKELSLTDYVLQPQPIAPSYMGHTPP